MYIKRLILEHLERKGYDGLWCPEVPCGCLKEDLAPCCLNSEDMDWSSCAAGYRRDVSASEKCGCDGQGTDHWHIGPNIPAEKALLRKVADEIDANFNGNQVCALEVSEFVREMANAPVAKQGEAERKGERT